MVVMVGVVGVVVVLGIGLGVVLEGRGLVESGGVSDG